MSEEFIEENDCDLTDSNLVTCYFDEGTYTLSLKGMNSGATTIDVYFEKESQK